MYLNQLPIGQHACIKGYAKGDKALLQRLLEMGLTRGSNLEIIRIAPLGDPIEISIRNYQLSLRKNEAALIEVEIS